MSIGTKIKALRMKKGYSQSELAEVFHVSAQAVSKWENDTSLPDISQLPAIASLFGITIDELFDYPENLEYERIEKMIDDGRMMSNELFWHCEDFLMNEIRNDPENYRANSMLGDLYHFHASKLNQKAVYYALEALEIKPDNKTDLDTLTNASNGHCNDWNIGCHFKLIETYKMLIQKHKSNQRTKLYLLDHLIADSRFDEADEILANSKIELGAFYRIWMKEKQYGFNQVQHEYEQLLYDYSDNWKMLMEIGNRCAYNHDYEKAIEVYEQAFDASPKPRYTDELASIRCLHQLLGNDEQALDACYRELTLLKEEWGITKGELVDCLQHEIELLQDKS